MDNRSNEYILRALRIADDLMDFSNDEVGLADEGGFGILFAVCRDCAYKIRRHVEQEGHKARRNWVHTNTSLVILTAALLSILFTSPASATTVILSTDLSETLGGLTFADGDLVEYNPTTDTATLFFGEILFSGNENIVAVHVLDNGNIILSTDGAATLGGLSFDAGDLVEYNPTTDTATLFFDGNLFAGGSENIDAVHVLDSGNIIISSSDDATLGGLTFGSGDLAEYNPIDDTATLFFDGNLFDGSENIDAVYILENGNLVLSTEGGATLGGLTFADGDLAEYNPATGVATLYFSEGLFSNNADIDAVYYMTLPEPTTIAMLGLGMMMFVIRRPILPCPE